MCECCGGDCRLCRGEEVKQPLNEAYGNDLLQAYQKISDTFDDFTQLMRKRVPYESWPKHLQIAGLDPDSLGPIDPPGTKIKGFDKWPKMEPIPDYTDHTSNHLIAKIQDMGRIEEKLLTLLDDEIFEKTNKHSPYWHSKDEDSADKLDDLRRKFSCMHDNLWDIISILRRNQAEFE